MDEERDKFIGYLMFGNEEEDLEVLYNSYTGFTIGTGSGGKSVSAFLREFMATGASTDASTSLVFNTETITIPEPDLRAISGIVSVNQLLQATRRILIRGDAGSGKTTLMQWIAVRSASKDFPEGLSSWNSFVPFLIRLRQCTNSELPSPEDFPRFVTPSLAGQMPKNWVHSLLSTGRACVLIDGVDEVSETRRENVRKWLDDLVGNFPKACYIVTSRPNAISEDWLSRLNFYSAELQPMDLTSINEFIDHWHEAVGEELIDPEEKIELETLPSRLKAVIKDNRPIRNLATNPLLCSMLCALHRDRKRQLPTDRIELYDAGCWMLLERRDLERGIELRDYPRLTYRQKRSFLKDLAYWMISNGWSEVSRERVEEHFNRRIEIMEGIEPGISARDISRYFLDRSGMIREPSVGKVDFTHRTFQEYLAAEKAIDEGNIGVLILNAHDDSWREVIILAAGLASTKVRGELILGLIDRGQHEAEYRQYLDLLAIACLQTAIDLSTDIRNIVKERVAEFIPFKSIDHVKMVASAGDLAIPYLSPHIEHTEPIAIACINALAIMGSDTAIDVICKYVDDSRPAVVTELTNIWDQFDRKVYAERVLSPLVSRTGSLEFRKINSLDEIGNITGLKRLIALDGSSLKVLEPLGELAAMEELRLYKCYSIKSLKPLAVLKNLKYLQLNQLKIEDLRPLKGLMDLEVLDLGGCENVDDLRPLANLKSLKILFLNGCTKVRKLEPISNLADLAVLDISGCTQVKDLSPLKSLKNLKKLALFNVPKKALWTWPVRGNVKIYHESISTSMEEDNGKENKEEDLT